MTRVDRVGALATRKTARGRLIVQRSPPRGWLPGWTPGSPIRRCECGAPVVVRSGRFSRCERGCTRLVAVPRPAPPPPAPLPPPAMPEALAAVVRDLRLLSRDFARDVRRGRRPSALAVELALGSVGRLKAAFPECAEEIARLLPWLSRRAGAERAA